MKMMDRTTWLLCILCFSMAHGSQNQTPFASRQADWRNGAVVYQVFVDRFAPSDRLEKKKHLYATPRSLHPWNEEPVSGHEDKTIGLWSHELAFWGGDLKSLEGKLGYIESLGVDVLYLNPIQAALTNHKYDALDWAEVAPEYGTRKDVLDIARGLHEMGLKLMLDGVFNHMGRNGAKFQSALHDPKSPYRDWFFFGSKYPGGYRAWVNVPNLPEVRVESPSLRDYLWAKPDSVVQKYLTDGVDGWRLDTAYELGPKYLSELTQAAHHAKPGSVVVGEVWNYPAGWFPALDGIMNFYARQIILDMLCHKISVGVASRMLERMVGDVGIEPLLKSWLVLDNHDTSRLKSDLPDEKLRHLAQVLQFTLPGSPVVYYGVEVGMEGKGDPGSRGPMRWDLATPDNPETKWIKKLITLRKSHPALKVGDYVALDSDRLLGFTRKTDRALDTVVVLVNPSDDTISESVSCREGRLMNGGVIKDLLTGVTVTSYAGIIDVTIPPRTARVFSLISPKGYTPYKRIH